MVQLPDHIRIKENSRLAKIAAWKLGSRSVAMVTGRTIHICGCTKEEFLEDEKWVKHELCHVKQYQQYGFFGFIFRYIWESLRKGYYNNRFEVEARAEEEL